MVILTREDRQRIQARLGEGFVTSHNTWRLLDTCDALEANQIKGRCADCVFYSAAGWTHKRKKRGGYPNCMIGPRFCEPDDYCSAWNVYVRAPREMEAEHDRA